MQENNLSVSVITPTYKGRSRLRSVYQSICDQTIQPEEWIIVIDGRDSETSQTCNAIKKQSKIPVYFFTISHNHKKAAVNAGIKQARGYFTLIADDDDTFPSTALETFLESYQTLSRGDQEKVCGIVGLCKDSDNKIIGDQFPKDKVLSNHIQMYFSGGGISGEKWGMYKTSLLKNFPFFEDAEGYVTEGTVWFEMAKHFQTLFINQHVRDYHIRQGSVMTEPLTERKFALNCQGWTYSCKYMAENFLGYTTLRPKLILMYCTLYIRYLLHCIAFQKTKNWMKPGFSFRAMLAIVLGMPAGVLLFLYDKMSWARKQ